MGISTETFKKSTVRTELESRTPYNHSWERVHVPNEKLIKLAYKLFTCLVRLRSSEPKRVLLWNRV